MRVLGKFKAIIIRLTTDSQGLQNCDQARGQLSTELAQSKIKTQSAFRRTYVNTLSLFLNPLHKNQHR